LKTSIAALGDVVDSCQALGHELAFVSGQRGSHGRDRRIGLEPQPSAE
jgi:hypothetical protein